MAEGGKNELLLNEYKVPVTQDESVLESCCKTKCLKNCEVGRSYVEYSYHKSKAKKREIERHTHKETIERSEHVYYLDGGNDFMVSAYVQTHHIV